MIRRQHPPMLAIAALVLSACTNGVLSQRQLVANFQQASLSVGTNNSLAIFVQFSDGFLDANYPPSTAIITIHHLVSDATTTVNAPVTNGVAQYSLNETLAGAVTASATIFGSPPDLDLVSSNATSTFTPTEAVTLDVTGATEAVVLVPQAGRIRSILDPDVAAVTLTTKDRFGNPTSLRPLSVQVVLTVRDPPTETAFAGNPFFWASPWADAPPYTPANPLTPATVSGSITIMVTGFFTKVVDVSFAAANDSRIDVSATHALTFLPAADDHVGLVYKGVTASVATLPSGTIDEIFLVSFHVEDTNNNIATGTNTTLSVTTTSPGGINTTRTVGISNGVGQLNLQFTGTGTAIFDLAAGQFRGQAEFVQITVESGVAVAYILIDPTDGDPSNPAQPGSADTDFTVFVEAHDQFGNIAVTEERDVSIQIVQGSSSIVFVTGSPVVTIVRGQGQSAIRDTTAETIVLGLADTSATGLAVTSTQDMVVVSGVAVSFFIRPVSDGILRTRLTVNLEIRDASANIAQSRSENVTLRVSGSVTPTTQVVVLINGVGSGDILDSVEEDVTLTLENSSDPSLAVASTRDVTFTADPIPPFIVMSVDPNTTALVDTSVTIRAIVRIGSQPLFAAEDVINAATLQITDPLGSLSTLPMVVTRGVSLINYDNQLSGVYTFQVTAPPNSGVVDSTPVNVTFVADVPATFLLALVPNGHPTPLTPTVNQSMVFNIGVRDRFGNPTDAAAMNVTVTVANEVHPTQPSPAARISPLQPVPNPLLLEFGSGVVGTFNVQLTVAEIARITMSAQFPSNVIATNTVNLTFLPAAPSIVYMLPIGNGTVDDSFTFHFILGDSFLNRVYGVSATIAISIHDATLGTVTPATVSIVDGTGSLTVSATLPTVVTVSMLAHASGFDVTDTTAISIESGSAVRYVLLDPIDGSPTDPTAPGSTDNTFAVSVEARDQYNNVATAEQRDVAITVRSGSAAFLSGSPTVDIVNGIGVVVMLDTVAEVVLLELSDTANTGLDVTSIQDVRIYWGVPFAFAIETPAPRFIAVGQFGLATVTVRDAGGNVNPTENRDVSLAVNGTASFSAIHGATIDPIELVTIINGTGSAHFTSSTIEVVRLSLRDTESTGLRVLSTQIAEFVSAADLVTRRDSRNINIQLNNDEMNRVKALIDLATSANDTFFCNSAGAMADIAGNPLPITTNAIRITAFSPDINPPTLDSFDLSMINAVPPLLMTLSFSESVNVSTLTPSSFVFQSAATSPQFSYRLAFTLPQLNTGMSPFSTEFADVVQIVVAEADRLAMEAQHTVGPAGSLGTGLARRVNNSFITVDVGAVRDMSGLNLLPISSTGALQVAVHTIDLIKPIIASFALDLNAGALVLTFSEVVNVSTFDVTKLTIDGPSPIPLTGGVLGHSGTSSIIRITFTDADLDAIKSSLPAMASSVATSQLTATAEIISDVASNTAMAVAVTDPLGATAYTADTTDAQLIAFDLDMNISTLTMTFSEVVNGSSIDVTQMILQSSASNSPSASYTLTTSTTQSTPARVQTVSFSSADSIAIKNNVDLATSTNTTFLFLVPRFQQLFIPVATDPTRLDILDGSITVQGGQIASTVAFDMSRNLISGILPGSALPVGAYTRDVLAPTIQRFEMNLDLGEVDLTFSEPVNVSAMQAVSLTFASSTNQSLATSYTLTGGVAISLSSTRLAKFFLTDTDLNAMKALPICTSTLLGADCFLSHDSNLVRDSAGVSVEERPVIFGLLVARYTADTTRPTIVPTGFQSFDLNTGGITISFSETVNATSFLASAIGVQTSFAGPNPSIGLFRHMIASGVVNSTAPSNVVHFTMSQADLDVIRVNTRLCSVASQCFLYINSGGINDMAHLPNSLIPDALSQDGRGVETLVADNIRPTLLSYSFNLNTSQLTLVFDEAVLPSTIVPTSLVFHTVGTGGNSYRLTAGVSTSQPGPTIVFDLSTTDVNAIKARQLVSDAASTILSFADNLLVDTAFAPNSVTAVSLRVASAYTADTTPPHVTSFSVDMNRQFGRLTLTFNEPVTPASITPTGISFQSDRVLNLTSTSIYTLTGGHLSATSNLSFFAFEFAASVIELDLSAADTTALKTNFGLNQLPVNTFLQVTAATATDTSGNPLRPVLSSNALGVSTVGVDNLPARIVSFSIDFEAKTITLSFDDVMDISTLNVQAFTIQSTPTAHLPAGNGLTYGLQASSSNSPDGYVVVLDMSPEDELAMNRIAGLAISINNTYLTATANALDDVDGRDMIAVTTALQSTSTRPDGTSPTLLNFELDLSLGVITLHFSEAANTSVLDSTALVLASTRGDGGSLGRVLLSISGDAGFTYSSNQTVAFVNLLASDMDALKLEDGIATSTSNTFLFHSAALSVDMTGNSIQPIATDEAVSARVVIADAVPPTLVGFDVDMDTRVIHLTFDEPIRVNTAVTSRIQLSNGGSVVHTLTGGTVGVVNGNTTTVALTPQDFNAVGSNALFASVADSFLSIVVGALQDMAGVNVSASVALQSSTFAADQRAPQIVDCAVNMNARTLTLFFSETVNFGSVNVSNILVQSDMIGSVVKRLNGTLGVAATRRPSDWPASTPVPAPGSGTSYTGITVALTIDDFDSMATARSLFTTVNNTYCQVQPGAIADVSANLNSAGTVAAVGFLADASRGQLQNFSVDLDQQILRLTFTEAVDLATFDVTAITLQTAQTAPQSVATTRQLTGAFNVAVITNVIQFELTRDDFIALAQGPALFTSANTSFVSITGTSIRDMAGNFISAAPNGNAVSTSQFLADATPPTLLSFDVDMNLGQVTLSFSEAVVIGSLTTPQITLSSPGGALARVLTTESVAVGPNGPTVVVALGIHDLNFIKRFAVASAQVVLTTAVDAVFDPFGNGLESISVTAAFIGSGFVADTTPPRLEAFDLDLTTFLLTLSFSEIVNASTIDLTRATLVGASSVGEHNRTLIGGSISHSSNFPSACSPPCAVDPLMMEFSVQLTPIDLDFIYRNTLLATQSSNTLLSWESNLVLDLFTANPATSRTFDVAPFALPVRNFVEDLVNPAFRTFQLNMTSRELSLQFSETINTQTVNVTHITLVNSAGVPTTQFALTGGTVLHTAQYPQPLAFEHYSKATILLSSADVNEINRLDDLCTAAEGNQDNQCFITMSSQLLQDMNSNPVTPVSVPVPVLTYSNDTIAPQFVTFASIDMTVGQLTVQFDETIRASTFDCREISLHPSHFTPTNFTFLSRCALVSLDATSATFNISYSDMNMLKSLRTICVSESTCYMRMTSAALDDMKGNSIVPVSVRSTFVAAEHAQSFTVDATAPTVTAFDANFDSGTLTLYFDETIDAATLSQSAITLQGFANAATTDVHTLQSSIFTTTIDGLSANLSFSAADLSLILAVSTLAINESSTYLTFTGALVRDMTGNDITPRVNAVNAILVSNFTLSPARPSVIAFESLDFSVNPATMQLSFSDAVELSTIDFTGIRLQADVNGNGGISTALTSNCTAQYIFFNSFTDKRQVILTFDLEFQRRIKLNFNLAISQATTFLSLAEGAFQTKHFGRVFEVSGFAAMPVTLYTADTSQPVLIHSSLDVDLGLLSLTFNDVVDIGTLDATRIAFQPSVTVGDPLALFLTATPLPTLEPQYQITFDLHPNGDLNRLKRFRYVATSINNTVVVLQENSFVDANVPALSVVATTQQITVFTADVTPPQLVEYRVDMGEGTLFLSFSETVDVETVDVTKLRLQSAAGDTNVSGVGAVLSTDAYSLTGGSVFGSDILQTPNRTATFFFINLTLIDFNELKCRYPLGLNASTTLLSLERSFVQDMNSNLVLAILSTSPMSPLSTGGAAPAFVGHTADLTRPELLTFNLNLNLELGQIILTFSDSVNSAVFDPTRVRLMSNAGGSGVTFRLRGGTMLNGCGNIQTIELTAPDMNTIKEATGLATNSSTTFISMPNTTVTDLYLNPLVAVVRQVDTYTDDLIRPSLISFTLDMDSTTFRMVFSQAVDPSTFDETQITIQASNTSAVLAYTLTGKRSLLTHTTVLPSTEFSLGFTLTDENAIKAMLGLAKGRSTTFLNVTADLIRDFSPPHIGNRNLATTVPVQVSVYTADTTLPGITNFDLDMNALTLSVFTTETVSLASVQPTLLTLQSLVSVSVNESNCVEAGGPVTLPNGVTVDCYTLEQHGCGTDLSNIFTGVAPGTLVSARCPCTCKTFTEGSSTPETRATSHTLASSSSVVSAADGPRFTIQLSAEDAHAIQANLALAATAGTTFLAVGQGAFVDTAAGPNALAIVPSSNASAVRTYTADSTRPQLVSFNFTMATDPTVLMAVLPVTLTMEFTEPILLASINMSGASLSDGATAASALTGSIVQTTSNHRTVALHLTAADVQTIRDTPGLAVAAGATVLDILPQAVTDTSGNLLISAVQVAVSTYFADFVRPVLTNFDTNMNDRSLTFFFSEPIVLAEVRLDTVQLQSDGLRNLGSTGVVNIGTGTTQGCAAYFDPRYIEGTINCGLNVTGTTLGAVDNFTTVNDGNSAPDHMYHFTAPLRALYNFTSCGSSFDSWLHIFRAHQNGSLGERVYTCDDCSDCGTAAAASLVLDVGHYFVVIDGFRDQRGEYVLSATCPNGVSSAPISTATRGGCIGASTFTRVVRYGMSNAESTALKLEERIFRGVDSSYISLVGALPGTTSTPGLSGDLAGNQVDAINEAAALKTRHLQRDIESPRLDTYTVDMITGMVVLTFSEAVDASSLRIASFSFANHRTTPTETYQFLSGQPSVVDGKILSFTLSLVDANVIRDSTTIGTLRTNSVLTFGGDALVDMYGNSVLGAVVGVNATLASTFTADTAAPLLEQFNMNMNTGVITLGYDQVVNFTSVQPSQFSLYNSNTTSAAVNYTLALGTFARINSTTIQIVLSLGDLNAIKRLSLCGAASGRAECFLGFGPDSVRDLEGFAVLPLVGAQTVQASEYVVDVTPPILVTTGFTELNLTSGELILSFSETVNVSSFSLPDSVTLQTSFESPNPGRGLNSFQLRSATMANTDDSSVVRLLLSADDLNAVKQDPLLCTVQANCYVALTGLFITDMAGVAVTATVFDLPGRRVQSLVADVVQPVLVSVEFDLDVDQLRLSFSETVATGTSGSAVIFGGISLQSGGNRTVAPNDFYTLTGGTVSHGPSTLVVVDLTSTDILAMKARRLGTSRTDTFIALSGNCFHDTAFNPNFVTAVSNEQARQALVYVRDARQPRLLSFTVDMNRRLGLLSLTFSEPVVPESITPTDITLLSEQVFQSSSTSVYVLTGGTLTAATDLSPTSFVYATTIIEIVMLEVDTTALKTNSALSSLLTNTFLRITPAVANDASGNPVQPIDGTFALAAAAFGVDNLPAQLVNFTLNMEDETLTLSFDDVMDVSSVVVAAFKIQSTPTAHLAGGIGLSYDLQSSTSSSLDGYVVVIDLSFDDKLALDRILGLASVQSNTFLTLTANAINDIDSRDVLSVTTALQASNFFPDVTAPSVTNFTLDMGTGDLRLTFSEAINTSVFSSTTITLINAQDQCDTAAAASPCNNTDVSVGGGNGSLGTVPWVDDAGRNCSWYATLPDRCYIPDQVGSGTSASAACCACGGGSRCSAPVQIALGGDVGVTFAANQVEAVITLLQYDLDLLKLSDLIATTPFNLFLSHTSGLTVDMTANAIAPVGGNDAIRVQALADDQAPPTLVAFVVDMTAETIAFTFSEPIRVSSMLLGGAKMVLESTSAGNGQDFNVAAGTLAYTSARTALFTMAQLEVFGIKLQDTLFTSQQTTHIHLNADFIVDMAGVRLQDSGISPATSFRADATAPVLLTYLLNLNHGTLLLNFDEPVAAQSTVLGGTTALLSAPSSSIVHNLRGGGASSGVPNGLQIVVNLTVDDLNEVKRLTGLATSRSNSFVSFTAGFVTDMAGVPVTPVTISAAQQADSFVNDITRPELVNFGLDMATEPAIITFTFEETVDVTSLRLGRIVLQEAFTVNVGDNATWHQLLDGLTLTAVNDTIVRAQLTEHDYATLKLKGIGSSPTTTWLTAVDGYILDMSSVGAATITNGVDARNVDQFVYDTTSPQIQFFDINLSTGILDIYFTEPVDASTFTAAAITLQNRQVAPP